MHFWSPLTAPAPLEQQHSLPATDSGLHSLKFTPPTWHRKHRYKYLVLSWQGFVPHARHLAWHSCHFSSWYGCKRKNAGLTRTRLCQIESKQATGMWIRGACGHCDNFFKSLCSPFQPKNLERFFVQISFSQRKVVRIPVLGLSGDAECLVGWSPKWSPKSVNGPF